MFKGSLYVDQYFIQYSGDTFHLTCDLLLGWYERACTSRRQETLYCTSVFKLILSIWNSQNSWKSSTFLPRLLDRDIKRSLPIFIRIHVVYMLIQFVDLGVWDLSAVGAPTTIFAET